MEKYKIEVYPFAYNKIVGNVRKIDIRPCAKNLYDVKIGDVIEYINSETKESVLREVKGVALFDNFDTMIEMLPCKLIGYDNVDEIKLRIERMYTKQEEKCGVMAIFIDEPVAKRMVKLKSFNKCA